MKTAINPEALSPSGQNGCRSSLTAAAGTKHDGNQCRADSCCAANCGRNGDADKKTGTVVSLLLRYLLMSVDSNAQIDWGLCGRGILVSSPDTASAEFVADKRLVIVLLEWTLPNNHV